MVDDGTFISPAVVRYGPDEAERFEMVVDHVLDHTYDQPGRSDVHGVFTTDDPLLTVDAAWARRAEDLSPIVQDNGNTVYRIDLGEVIGYTSGEAGCRCWSANDDLG